LAPPGLLPLVFLQGVSSVHELLALVFPAEGFGLLQIVSLQRGFPVFLGAMGAGEPVSDGGPSGLLSHLTLVFLSRSLVPVVGSRRGVCPVLFSGAVLCFFGVFFGFRVLVGLSGMATFFFPPGSFSSYGRTRIWHGVSASVPFFPSRRFFFLGIGVVQVGGGPGFILSSFHLVLIPSSRASPLLKSLFFGWPEDYFHL